MTRRSARGGEHPWHVLESLDGPALRAVLVTFRDALRSRRAEIDNLNVYPVPDGDTGTNMAHTLQAVVDELTSAGDDLDAVCEAIAHGSLMGARGNSGVILSQILRGLCDSVRGAADIDGPAIADGLSAASDAAYEAVLAPVEGTMLTVCREAAESAVAAAAAGGSLVEVLRAARERGLASLDRTPDLLPILRDAGVVDAGGAGLLLLLDAALLVVAGDPLPEPRVVPDGPVTLVPSAVEHVIEGMRYEVMFLLEVADERIASLKSRWGLLGSSVVVVGGGGTWNCHVHTNDIGAAIESALDLDGRPSGIRVTDLFVDAAIQGACAVASHTTP